MTDEAKKKVRRKRKAKETSTESPSAVAVGEQTASNTQNYNAVVGAAQLADIILVSSNFKVEPGHFEAKAEKSFSYQLSDVKVTVNSEQGRAQGAFTWKVQATYAENTTFMLFATYIAVYVNVLHQQEDSIRAFVRRVGTFATYPYFRSHASHISWASKAELPTLPVLTEGSLVNQATEAPEA